MAKVLYNTMNFNIARRANQRNELCSMLNSCYNSWICPPHGGGPHGSVRDSWQTYISRHRYVAGKRRRIMTYLVHTTCFAAFIGTGVCFQACEANHSRFSFSSSGGMVIPTHDVPGHADPGPLSILSCATPCF